MKKQFYFSILILALSGCDLIDKAKAQVDHYKNVYEEVREGIDAAKRGPKPFTEVFQKETDPKQLLISSSCASNQDVKDIYFSTPTEATQNVLNSIKSLYSYPAQGTLRPFWDLRYVNPVSTYIHHNDGSHYANHSKLTSLDSRTGNRNIITGTATSQTDFAGSLVQSKCVNGTLTAGTTINLNDAPMQYIEYAGPQSTFAYQLNLNNHVHPWKSNKSGNLMMQAHFDKPIYRNYGGNIGGSVSFALYLYNPKLKKRLSYIIGIYASGVAWTKEKAGIRFDPTTNIIHVATVIKKPELVWWSSKSPKSNSIWEVKSQPNKTTKDDAKWDDFYRTNISYNNLKAVLDELKKNPPASVAGQDFGLNPEDWEIYFIAIQYELEEKGGKASLSGSFKGFEAYTSNLPL